MQTARSICQSDAGGVVEVRVPVGTPGRRIEVLVVWEDVSASEVPGTAPEELGWPPGFFSRFVAALPEASTLARPEQPPLAPVEALEPDEMR